MECRFKINMACHLQRGEGGQVIISITKATHDNKDMDIVDATVAMDHDVDAALKEIKFKNTYSLYKIFHDAVHQQGLTAAAIQKAEEAKIFIGNTFKNIPAYKDANMRIEEKGADSALMIEFKEPGLTEVLMPKLRKAIADHYLNNLEVTQSGNGLCIKGCDPAAALKRKPTITVLPPCSIQRITRM